VYKRKSSSESSHYSPTLLLLVIIATIGAMAYFSFLMRPENRGDLIPYLMVVVAESFIIFHALTAMWTILAGTQNPRHFGYHNAQAYLFSLNKKKMRYNDVLRDKKILPSQHQLVLHRKPIDIDVFITVYGEPIDEIYRTAKAARDMVGVHDTIILDDGASDEVQQIADELQIGYIRRTSNQGAKAGNINNALAVTEGEFFVIFDADFVAKAEFLYETMPFFEDSNVAFVQTPQSYSNHDTVISRGAGFIQSVFYKLIQPGKNRFNAAFCVGTNVVFRRRAIESIGGMYEKSKSEDIWTSILLHEKGYRSVFITDVLAVGQTPDTIKAYSKQQLRWATGGFEILLRHNPLIRKLTLDQKLQYFHTITYYLHGFAILFLILLPPIAIYFDLSPVTVQIAFLSWLLFYLSFYGLQVLLAFYTMGGFRAETLVLAMASFPIYIRAFLNALFKKDEAWQATGNKKGIDSPFNYIVPQLMIFIFLLVSTIVGVWKVYYYETFSLALFWCLINTLLLGSFVVIALKEHRMMKSRSKSHARRRLKAVKNQGRTMKENTN
jgi:cellulose synthase (UDP-forming)